MHVILVELDRVLLMGLIIVCIITSSLSDRNGTDSFCRPTPGIMSLRLLRMR